MNDSAKHAWYVAYGSNLDEDRLANYLVGGTYGDARHPHPGARDDTPPADERVVDVPGSLWFGGHSRTWDGGVAHFDDQGEGRVVGRAWRMSVGQVSDIAAQESKVVPGSLRLTEGFLRRGGVLLSRSRYGRVVTLDPIDDEPAVTFTFVDRPARREPSLGYLGTMVRGLRQCDLDDDEIGDYLLAHGCGDARLVTAALVSV